MIGQQQKMLPELLLNPQAIVNRKFKHKCKDPENGTIEWYKGKVICVHRHNDNPIKTEFTVKYEEDEDEWFFPLLQDLKNGDLMFV